MLTLTHSSTIL